MFAINHKPQFQRTIEIAVPDGAGQKIETIFVTFTAKPESDLAAFNTNELEGQKDLLRDVICDVQDVVEMVDGKPQPVAFSPALLDELLTWSYARLALLRGYAEALAETRVGN